MKKKRLTREELAIVEALLHDVAATVGVSDEAAYRSTLIAETLDLLGRTTQRHDLLSFRDYVVDDFQQRMHDECIDVSWPRCPRHPNHPMWLNDGAWWCTTDNVAIARLGELTVVQTNSGRWRYHRPAATMMTTTFIRHPGRPGAFGALMDEYARAAEDFCRVVERFDLTRFDAERPSDNPNTVSPRAISLHVIGAAHRYAHYIRKARHVDFIERYEADPARLRSPQDVRGLLTEGIVLTETTVEPLLTATEHEIQALSFVVRWGPRYDPEMIIEHAVCHVLRHRRQLERW